MNTQQAVQTLVNAVQLANKRGAFDLAESKILAEAVEALTVKEDKSVEKAKDEAEDKADKKK